MATALRGSGAYNDIKHAADSVIRRFTVSGLLCLCNLTLADVNLQFIPGARRCHKRTH